MYADTAITLLLPQLEGGRFDDNWKIRYRRPSLQNQWSQWKDDHCQCQGWWQYRDRFRLEDHHHYDQHREEEQGPGRAGLLGWSDIWVFWEGGQTCWIFKIRWSFTFQDAKRPQLDPHLDSRGGWEREDASDDLLGAGKAQALVQRQRDLHTVHLHRGLQSPLHDLSPLLSQVNTEQNLTDEDCPFTKVCRLPWGAGRGDLHRHSGAVGLQQAAHVDQPPQNTPVEDANKINEVSRWSLSSPPVFYCLMSVSPISLSMAWATSSSALLVALSSVSSRVAQEWLKSGSPSSSKKKSRWSVPQQQCKNVKDTVYESLRQ